MSKLSSDTLTSHLNSERDACCAAVKRLWWRRQTLRCFRVLLCVVSKCLMIAWFCLLHVTAMLRTLHLATFVIWSKTVSSREDDIWPLAPKKKKDQCKQIAAADVPILPLSSKS